MSGTLRILIWGIAMVLLGVAATLWSWNTIAGLFDGPVMHIEHAMATLLLLGLARTILRLGRRRRHHERIYGYED